MTESTTQRTATTGLTRDDVATRVAAGLTNGADDKTSRSLAEIVRANVLTRFNAMLTVLAVAVLLTGNYGDALFAIVLVINALVGIIQELRAKVTLDRLAVLSTPLASVVRDGVVTEVALAEIVLDDLVLIRAGDQVPADGMLHLAEGLEIDESALTGESDPEAKEIGASVLSGTIVVAGMGRFQATAVGPDSYARRITAEAKVFTRARSELQDGINLLLKYVTWIIVGVTPLLIWSQIRTSDAGWRDAVTGTVAALVGMIPEGLVLLTTLAFLLAALALARRNVLVQELPAVEGLARVDVVCLDKTGTLTAGGIVFEDIEYLGESDPDEVATALTALAADPEANASLQAIGTRFSGATEWVRTSQVAFSSARKWSASSFGPHGTWVLGAPDVLLEAEDPALERVAALASEGRRVLLIAASPSEPDGESKPPSLDPRALCILGESIRPDAADTLAYFQRQGVAVKVISGDNPVTVAAIARRVGIDVGEPVDARTIGDTPEEIATIVEDATVFGRVSPRQKRAMVQALQANGHTVAMTGDGVNDALALKDADIGVAMGNGAPATRAVAQLVLLDGRFDQLPVVLGEGRRVIANIERVASLFVTKNVYSFLLTILVALAGLPYPFVPRHLTLISSITIGIPAFCLALVPNNTRYRPGFLRRVLRFAIPTGSITALAIFAAYLVVDIEGATPIEKRTAATIAALVVALWVLAVLARPWTTPKVALVATMAGIAAAAIAIPVIAEAFQLEVPAGLLPQALAIGAAGAFGVELVGRWVQGGPSDPPATAQE